MQKKAVQERQARKMTEDGQISLDLFEIGDNVWIPIPHVDCGHADQASLIGVVMNIDDGKYKLAPQLDALSSMSHWVK